MTAQGMTSQIHILLFCDMIAQMRECKSATSHALLGSAKINELFNLRLEDKTVA